MGGRHWEYLYQQPLPNGDRLLLYGEEPWPPAARPPTLKEQQWPLAPAPCWLSVRPAASAGSSSR